MNLTHNDGWVGYLTKQPYLIVFPRLLLYTRPPVNQQNGMTSLVTRDFTWDIPGLSPHTKTCTL